MNHDCEGCGAPIVGLARCEYCKRSASKFVDYQDLQAQGNYQPVDYNQQHTKVSW